MKKIMFLVTLFAGFAAEASLEFQMKNILGDWSAGEERYLFRVRQQTDSSVKVYFCDAKVYASTTGFCEYSKLLVLSYSSDRDSFYLAEGGGFCSMGLQISAQTPNQMLLIENPENSSRCQSSASVVEYKKIP